MAQSDRRMVYESPDGGKTVRAREFGEHAKWDTEVWESQACQAREFKLFTEIWMKGRTDPQIGALLDQARTLYLLSNDG